MIKQDQRLRNRRVRKQAGIIQKEITASVNRRILQPLLRNIRKESALSENSLFNFLDIAFNNADLNNRVLKLRQSRNQRDIKAYGTNYLNELTRAYNAAKKKSKANTH